MSRIANNPVTIPSGVEVQIDTNEILVKGSKTSLSMSIHNGIEIKKEDNILSFSSLFLHASTVIKESFDTRQISLKDFFKS